MRRILSIFVYSLQYIYQRLRRREKEAFEVVFTAVNSLGGVYVKLLQFISLRVDLIPKPVKQKLLTFYDQVPVEEIDIQKVLSTEIGSKKLGIFKKIDQTPFASGTFGQVYKAVLSDETEVVIKVRRSNLEQGLQVDFVVIRLLGWVFNLFYYQRMIDVPKLINEFKEITRKELDYEAEVENALYLHKHYIDHPVLYIPFTYKNLSTKEIIVQEYVGGVSGTDLLRMKDSGVDFKQELAQKYNTDVHFILERLSYDSMWQIFSLDRFYSDPHPGNIKILANNRYAFIDFGIMAASPSNKRDYYQIIKFLSQDAEDMDALGLGEQLLSIGTNYLMKCLQTYDRILSKPEATLKQTVYERYGELIDGWREQFRQSQMGDKENYTKVWLDLFQMGERFNMKMPKGLFSGLRASALIKSFSSAVDSDFHPMSTVFGNIAKDIDGGKLLNLDDIETQSVGIEEAVETVSDWFASLAEVDLLLHQDLLRLST